MGLSTRNSFQNAWVVDDFDRALAFWTQTLGVGPFYATEFDSASSPGLTYRGEPGELTMRVAWAQAGDTQIELIQPYSATNNVYRDLFPAGQGGFHHVCFWSEDFDGDIAYMEKQGYPPAMRSGDGGTRFAYFDTSSERGHMVELLERGPMEGVFERIRQAAAEWDGSQPLRALADLL